MWSLVVTLALAAPVHPWGPAADGEPFSTRFAPPPGFARVQVSDGSFGAWLRELPLRPGRPPVQLYDGTIKARVVHVAVIDIDVGDRDLQQCADAAIRLWAEHVWASGRTGELCVTLTSGAPVPWSRWANGERPSIDARNQILWTKAAADDGRAAFRRYLDFVFTYAGSASLARTMVQPEAPRALAPGDLLVQGGSPGHVVVVVDAAVGASGERVVALAQSFMPAQQMHVLDAGNGTPWFRVPPRDQAFVTPEWTFPPGSARRFSPRTCPRP